MSNFVVSALKYRPQRFEDVVGQAHVAQTLKNALKNDHLAHAFLFCGPRGVGKTTCARILAKVLNCQNITTNFEPCNKCESCQAFSGSSSFNIMELDAASNNSVDHIRALVEQVRFQPQQGKYKIFIIDEVHMLSQAAFNAFLKTLEEPPPYAIFILATTEKHKIIPTILSRCQIFDFKRIQITEMVAHLQNICKEENIQADKDALHIIAQKADGALRDALSIFDRIVSFSGNKITYEDVIKNLNVLDYEYFFKFTDALLMQDLSNVLVIFDDILRNGFEGDLFINGLATHLRNLLVCKDVQTLKLLELSDSLKKRYQEQSQIAPASFLLTALNIANDCDLNFKMARHKRLHVELSLIKMTYISQAIELAKNPPLFTEKKTLDLSESPQKKVVSKVDSSERSQSPSINKVQEPPTSSSYTPLPEQKKATPNLRQHTKLGTKKLKSLADLDNEINRREAKKTPESEIVLTLEKVKTIWTEYLNTTSQVTIKNTMNSAALTLQNRTLKVTVGSSLAVNTMRQERKLMDFLREKLGTQNLSLEIDIDPEKAFSKTVKKRPKPMTDSEKFWRMKELNPSVDEMRKRFDLKLEQN